MNPWTFFHTSSGKRIRFRRKHPAETYAGCPGILGFTMIDDFTVRALHFRATNDLACADAGRISMDPTYHSLLSYGKIGVAVCVLRNTSAEERDALAKALNDAIIRHPKAA